MVEKMDGTIGCINNVFREGYSDKPERVIQNRKHIHDKVRKEKCMHVLNITDAWFTWKVFNWSNYL